LSAEDVPSLDDLKDLNFPAAWREAYGNVDGHPRLEQIEFVRSYCNYVRAQTRKQEALDHLRRYGRWLRDRLAALNDLYNSLLEPDASLPVFPEDHPTANTRYSFDPKAPTNRAVIIGYRQILLDALRDARRQFVAFLDVIRGVRDPQLDETMLLPSSDSEKNDSSDDEFDFEESDVEESDVGLAI
jgi:hypothetical protein